MQLVIQWSTRSSMRDTGEISPGRGGDGEDRGGKFLRVLGRWGKGVVQVSVTGKNGTWGRWGVGGLISRLCVHFFLDFASRGWPISFPRSFSPIALSILPKTWLLGIAFPLS